MNARIKQVISRTEASLKDVLRQNSQFSSSVAFQPRHAEHLAAAGFGFPNMHAYLAAEKAGSERCSGYYIPDSAMIVARMTELGYPPAVVGKCLEVFVQAVTNDPYGAARADLIDDLQGQRVLGSNRLANHSRLVENLKYDILRDESSLWTALARHGIEHDDETEDNLIYSIELPPDFPSLYHMEQTIDVPFVVIFDLEQGEDQEALFYRENRQLGFRGNLRLKSSGKRGWAYPTIRMEEAPFVDHRTPAERRGEYPVHQGPDIDEQEFDNGTDAGRADRHPPPQASFDFLAGWVMTANDMNGTGHMSTGQIKKAFYGALANAKTLGTLNRRDAFDLAAQACRYLASNRIRRALEELIRENAVGEEGW